ncbi:uncharacterized protein LOC119108835 [Pollicipes pollicipes]|uniref:uncharacterized protein LOC119108835 n=1 Tax=Pollicipes pollicipes TaxID=41117 RepID=UPI00188515B4|nr:uncharacterized protein LOC119108835 [Pollicipes pollicipes]
MADRRIPFLGFGGGGGGDYEHAFELRPQHVPVQSRHFAPGTYDASRARSRQRSTRELERSRRWQSRLGSGAAQEESDLSSTMSSGVGPLDWRLADSQHRLTGEVDNMAYVHPTEWSDDRLTLYPQLTSTPLSRAEPQTPYPAAPGGAAAPPGGRSQYPLPSDALPHAGCGKEVAFRLKQSPMAAVWRKLQDQGGGRRRSGLLLCLLLFCIGLLIGAVSVVLYLTVAPDIRRGGAVPADDQTGAEAGDMMTFQGEFTVTNRPFKASYSDPSSVGYRRLASKLEEELDALFRASNLSSAYNASTVLALRPSSPAAGAPLSGGPTDNVTKVEVLVRLKRPSPDGVVTIGTTFIEGMGNAHRRMWLGRFNVKLDDISFSVSRTTLPPPPPSTTPPLPIDVRWGSWEDWSPCVPCNVNYTQTRQRKCLLNNGSGVLLDPGNIWPCLRLNQGADMEHRDCQPPPPPPPQPNRFCDRCVEGEVCVQLSGQAVPECQTPADADDPLGCGGLCKLDVERCHQISDRAYQCLDDSLCQSDEFRCLYGTCLKNHMRCDGRANCSDWDLSDELDCECDRPDHFQCGNQTSCLPISLRCDGVPDCWDGFDEVGCES